MDNARDLIQRTLNPQFSRWISSHDVASNTCQALYRHVIDTHFEPLFLD